MPPNTERPSDALFRRRLPYFLRIGVVVLVGGLGVVPSLINLPTRLAWMADVGGVVVILAFVVGAAMILWGVATVNRR
jgi:hypothetical protein